MNSPASSLRRDHDQQLLLALIERSGGELVADGKINVKGPSLGLILKLPTSASAQYPAHTQAQCRFQIQLPARYPFAPPTASVASPVWHPNVFANGTICLGSRWQATEGLDLFATRVARLLCFDPLLVNLNSVAHQGAAQWYRQTQAAHPEAFPSLPLTPTHWLRDPRGTHQVRPRVEHPCPNCNAVLRLPGGRQGVVQCPKCQQDFEVTT